MPVFTKSSINIVFLHIPKTGGSTIYNFFSDLGFNSSLYCTEYGRDSAYRNFINPPQHLPYRVLKEIVNINKCDFAFTTLRDPILRFKSSYVHFNRKSSLADLQSKELQMKTVGILLRSHLESFSNNTSANFENQIFRRQVDFMGNGVRGFRLEHDLEKLEIKLYDLIKTSSPIISTAETFKGMISNRRVRQRATISGVNTKEIKLHKDVQDLVTAYYRKDIELYNKVSAGDFI